MQAPGSAAKANPRKCNGLAAIIAGHAGGLVKGRHTQLTGTIGDLFLTVANGVLKAGIEGFPTATRTLDELFRG